MPAKVCVRPLMYGPRNVFFQPVLPKKCVDSLILLEVIIVVYNLYNKQMMNPEPLKREDILNDKVLHGLGLLSVEKVRGLVK